MAGNNKDRLMQNLSGTPAKPDIQRGWGVVLSTQQEDAKSHDRIIAETHNSDTAESQKRKSAKDGHERINRGYMLREDYIHALKVYAANNKHKLYEVMEEALAEYISSKGIELPEQEG